MLRLLLVTLFSGALSTLPLGFTDSTSSWGGFTWQFVISSCLLLNPEAPPPWIRLSSTGTSWTLSGFFSSSRFIGGVVQYPRLKLVPVQMGLVVWLLFCTKRKLILLHIQQLQAELIFYFI